MDVRVGNPSQVEVPCRAVLQGYVVYGEMGRVDEPNEVWSGNKKCSRV